MKLEKQNIFNMTIVSKKKHMLIKVKFIDNVILDDFKTMLKLNRKNYLNIDEIKKIFKVKSISINTRGIITTAIIKSKDKWNK